MVGLARRIEPMKELEDSLSGEKGKFYPMYCDMSKEEDILNAFQWIEENLGGVSILINNAGLTQPTSLMGMFSSLNFTPSIRKYDIHFAIFVIRKYSIH